MNKLIISVLILLSFQALGAEDSLEEFPSEELVETPTVISTVEAAEVGREFNAYKSHWLISFGYETGKYEVPWSFRGTKKNFSPTGQGLSGGRLGFGREIFLGKGLMTATKVEGYYLGTLFTKAINAGPEDDDIEFASTKKASSVYGVDAVQSLSYLFELKTKNPLMDEWSYLTVEPFIEAGIGKARAYNSVKYEYLLASVQEYHRQRISDDITNARIGAGINFTSSAGYFLYLRATQNRFDISQRKMRGRTNPNGSGETSLKTTTKNVAIDPVTIYAVGGGYKF